MIELSTNGGTSYTTSVSAASTTVTYTFKNVTKDDTIAVTFAINIYGIRVIQGAHGTITPDTASIQYGGSQQFLVTPDAGYHLDSVVVDGGKVDSTISYTFVNVTSAHTITAYFAINVYTLAVDVPQGGGTVTKNPDQISYTHGTSVQLTPVPQDLSWKFSAWGGDTSGSANPLTLVMTRARSITATFVRDSAYLVSYRTL